MAELDDEPDYHFYGTEIENEYETRQGQHRKEVRDPAATRALPLHKQEVTDEQGRRRFHGAFTGGFSAGYFNTVGSKEGWQPSSFRSSRDSRAAVQQSVEQYLDEDELEELRRTNLQTTAEYDTFGSTAAELARRAASDAAAERPSAIPGLLPDELVVPVADSVGIRLLQRMGWRQGKGIGVSGDTPTDADEEAEEAAVGAGGGSGSGRRRRWGQHASVAADNTQLHLLAPKTDVHGLGYDPFKGAEDFRRLKEQRQAAARPGQAEGRKRRRGIAFGSGVLDEEDGYGEGTTLDDYVTHDDVGAYDDEIDAGGMPRSRAPKLAKGGLGDRLARRGYSFEIMEEEEEDQGALEWHPAHRQQQYALPGREATLLLQSKEHAQGKGGLVPGFVRATAVVTLAFFPPPAVPADYVPLHRPSREAEAALPAAAAKFEPPRADPPADGELRQAIDSLAFFVARNGVIFESMARQRQQKEGRHAFLSGGEGVAYYRWKVHTLRSIMQQPQQQRRRPRQAIGQRSAPLSADERGALLGEQPLEASAGAGAAASEAQKPYQGWATGVEGGQAAAAAAVAAGEGQQALRRQLLQVAEADRQRLQSMLSRNFVAAESKEMLQPDAEAAAVAGLRPGVPRPPPRPVTGPAVAGVGRIVTEADLARPVEQPGAGASLAIRPGGGAREAAARRLPVRRAEEWRPLPLLCKRLNVPDPYHGRPAELQMSRFRTDHLALPDTAAAVASTLTAVPEGAQDFLLPPSVASAIKEAEARQAQQAQQQQVTAQGAAPPALQPAAPSAQPQDAAGAADAFLNSLSDMLGGGGGSAAHAAAPEAAPPLPPGPPPPLAAQAAQQQQAEVAAEEEEAGEAERPVDLFKAIFEDSEEEEEEEEEQAADLTAQQQQPEQQLAPEAAAVPAQQAAAQQQQQGGPTAADGDGRLAQHVQQQPQHAQQQQQQQGFRNQDGTFGFAKLRRQQAAGPGAPPLPPAAAAAAAAEGAGLDEATRRRVQEALRVLSKSKRERDERGSKKKRKKEKKERKDKKGKHKGSGKEKGRKHKRSSKEGRQQHKERRRRGSEGASSSEGSSEGSSSGSDSE